MGNWNNLGRILVKWSVLTIEYHYHYFDNTWEKRTPFFKNTYQWLLLKIACLSNFLFYYKLTFYNKCKRVLNCFYEIGNFLYRQGKFGQEIAQLCKIFIILSFLLSPMRVKYINMVDRTNTMFNYNGVRKIEKMTSSSSTNFGI